MVLFDVSAVVDHDRAQVTGELRNGIGDKSRVIVLKSGEVGVGNIFERDVWSFERGWD